MFINIRKEIMNAKFPAEITYHSVQPDWGALTADYIDKHQDTEAIQAKISYNNISAKLVIRIMPTHVYACHTNWYILVRDQWQLQNLLTLVQLSNIRMFTDNTQAQFAAPYANSRENPRPLYYARQPIPTFVCHRGRMVRIARATHGRHETVDEWGLSICQDCAHHQVCEKGQHQSSHRQGRAVYPRRSGKPVLLATSSHISGQQYRHFSLRYCWRFIRKCSSRRCGGKHASSVEHRFTPTGSSRRAGSYGARRSHLRLWLFWFITGASSGLAYVLMFYSLFYYLVYSWLYLYYLHLS